MNLHVNWAWILILFAMFGGFQFLNNLIHMIKDIFAKNKDAKITTGLIEKYPLVNIDFYHKDKKEQIIENNQEIHERRIENQKMKERFENLELFVAEMNLNFNKKLEQLMEAIEKRG